ncbi:MAG: ThuA domain-containing protein [Planctomycetota bacterium]
MKKALIVWGGWDGHEPKQVAELFRQALVKKDFAVEVSDTLDAYKDQAKLESLNLIVPVWTMGSIAKEHLKPLLAAVNAGVGIAGCHGGMCDSFRNETEYQFMTGGQWVAHPGNDGIEYKVNMNPAEASEITRGIADFTVKSEQYYMHVDPAVRVLATTTFPAYNNAKMPVVWTKTWGQGKVFYCSLGHHADIIAMPPVTELMTRGFLWAAK